MSETLYEGQKVQLSRFTGPVDGNRDRRRYQLLLNLPRAGMSEGVVVAAAWVTLTRDELHQVARAIHGGEDIEPRSPDWHHGP